MEIVYNERNGSSVLMNFYGCFRILVVVEGCVFTVVDNTVTVFVMKSH